MYKNKKTEYIYSTFSPILKSGKYKRILCPAKNVNFNCMNQKCVVDIHDKGKAICECNVTNNHGNKWSTWAKKTNKSKNKCNFVSGSRPIMTAALQNAVKS